MSQWPVNSMLYTDLKKKKQFNATKVSTKIYLFQKALKSSKKCAYSKKKIKEISTKCQNITKKAQNSRKTAPTSLHDHWS